MLYSVTLSRFIQELQLEILNMPNSSRERLITSAQINRPGLIFAGYSEHFDATRIQICGNVEIGYLSSLPAEEMRISLERLFSCKPPAIIVARSLEPMPEMLELSEQYEVPILGSSDATSNLMSSAISYLNVELAPRITRHGVFIEVYGEGILILGESGIGKSETAIELVKRGHRFIADDAVELRRVSGKTIVGRAPDNIRHFAELRGVGIVNVRRVFGMGSVKPSERVDLVIQMEKWNELTNYDRLGIENEYVKILDVKIPSVTIPVSPGRNLAIIIEVAAINNRQKNTGYNSAQELFDILGYEDN